MTKIRTFTTNNRLSKLDVMYSRSDDNAVRDALGANAQRYIFFQNRGDAMSIISDSMTVPLKGDFTLGVTRRGKKYLAEFIDWQRNEIITVEGSTAQISRARMFEVILSHYYNGRAALPEYVTIRPAVNKK